MAEGLQGQLLRKISVLLFFFFFFFWQDTLFFFLFKFLLLPLLQPRCYQVPATNKPNPFRQRNPFAGVRNLRRGPSLPRE